MIEVPDFERCKEIIRHGSTYKWINDDRRSLIDQIIQFMDAECSLDGRFGELGISALA